MTDPQNPPNDDAEMPEVDVVAERPAPAEAFHAANPLLAPTAAQAPTSQPLSLEEILHETRSRVTDLENAFHAFLSHEGASHPAVVSWASRIKARIVNIFRGTPQPPTG